MIISCEICKKKFNVDDKLIPEKGRQLQCSSCGHKWFFNFIKKKSAPLREKIKKQIDIKKINVEEKIPPDIDNIIKEAENNSLKDTVNLKNYHTNTSFLNMLMVFLISFVAFVILLDTFKVQINILIPGFNFLLDNFYESVKDLYSFLKDLIR